MVMELLFILMLMMILFKIMALPYLKMTIWFGKVSALDSIAHMILTDQLEESLITIPNPFKSSSNIDLAIGIQKNSHKKVEIINNTPFISCEIFLGATIKTSGKDFDYTTTKNIEIVETELSKYLEKVILDYLYTISKDYEADVLNFENMLSNSCLTNQELENYHWDSIYKDSYFKVIVNTNVNSTHLFDKE